MHIPIRLTPRIGAVLVVFFLVSCGFEESAWESATTEGTIDGYERFVEEYPDGKYAGEAASRRDELEAERVEAEAWSRAVAENTVNGFRDFQAAYPSSQHAEEAEMRGDRVGTFLGILRMPDGRGLHLTSRRTLEKCDRVDPPDADTNDYASAAVRACVEAIESELAASSAGATLVRHESKARMPTDEFGRMNGMPTIWDEASFLVDLPSESTPAAVRCVVRGGSRIALETCEPDERSKCL